MKRRKYIASSSIIATGALSGCLGIFSGSESDDEYPELPSEERVDSPPYEINRPPRNEDEWNPDYLGENLDSSPTINFSTVNNVTVDNPKLSINNMVESNEFIVRVIDNEDKMNDILRVPSDFNINFDNEILLIIESGYGSTSRSQQWKRIEETSSGIHVHGYKYVPYDTRADFKSVSSVLRVDRPSTTNNITADVSLTVDQDFRINFDSTEDVVRIEVIT